MAKLDSLIVDLQMNTAELKKGLDDANKKLKDFDSQIKDLAGVIEFQAIGEMALEAGKMLAEFALQGAETADQMGKLAQSAGISVESFSQLNYAAGISHLSTEDLGVAFNKLDKAIAEAAAGSAKQAGLFQALGVSVKDSSGEVRAADDVLGDLADRFSQMQDGASKTALAIEIFGKSGSKLIPLLNEGKDGIAELKDEADRLGITLSGNTVRAATAFNDNMEKLKRSFDAVSTQVAAQLAPAMASLTSQMLNSKDRAQDLKDLADVLAGTLKVLASVAVGVGATFQGLGKTLAFVASAIVDGVHGDWASIKANFIEFQEDVGTSFDKAFDKIKGIWEDTAQTADESGKKITGAIDSAKVVRDAAANEKGINNWKEAIKELTKQAEEYQAKVKGFGEDPVVQLSEKLNSGELTHGITNMTGKLGELRDKILHAATDLERLASQKLQIEIDYKVQAANAGAYKQSSDLAKQFDQIGNGLTQLEQLTKDLAESGFKDFDDALKQYGDSINAQALAQGIAEHAKAINDTAAADAAQRTADASGAAATSALAAANKFKTLADKNLAETEQAINNANHAIGAALSSIASKLGELGSVIQGVVQGYQSGGIYGAIAALIIELFSRFKRFSEIVDKATAQLYGAISQLSPFFDKLTDAFEQFQTMLGTLTTIMDEMITPIINTVAKSLSYFAQALQPILGAIEPLVNLFTTLMNMFAGLIEVTSPLEGMISLLSVVFNGISLGILTVVGWIESALADFLEGIRKFLASLGLNDMAKAISDVEISIENAAQSAKDQADALNEKLSAQLNDPFATGSNDVNNGKAPSTDTNTDTTTTDTTNNLGDLGTAANTAATALDKYTQSITNAPTGFKYALRAYQATAASVWAPDAGGGTKPGGVLNVNVQVMGGVMMTVAQLVQAVQSGIDAQNFRSGGLPPINSNAPNPQFKPPKF